MKTSEILTAVVAICGLALSIFNTAKQYLSDRVKIRLSVQKDSKIIGDSGNEIITILTIVNDSKRPVTIRHCGAMALHPNYPFVIQKTTPNLPCEITEGQFITAYASQAGLDLSTIDYWEVWDAQRRVYKLRESSRFKHWRSALRWKWEARKWKRKAAASKSSR